MRDWINSLFNGLAVIAFVIACMALFYSGRAVELVSAVPHECPPTAHHVPLDEYAGDVYDPEHNPSIPET